MYLHSEQGQDEQAERALGSLLGDSRPGEAVVCSALPRDPRRGPVCGVE